MRWSYGIGVTAVLVAALCGSMGGLLVRLVESADGWQILFYRSVTFSLTVFLFMLCADRKGLLGKFANIGILGAIVAVCLGSAFIAYLFSIFLTTVANAVFILSSSPFIAAVLSRIFLREKVSTVSWACMVAGLVGVAIMMAEGALSGTILGSAIAFIAAFGYASSVVAFRAGRNIDMMPATCLAGVFAAVVSSFLVDDFVLSQHDLIVAVLLGSIQIGLQYIIITMASRYVAATEVTLLMLLEVVAAPIWVWMLLGEKPAGLVLAGGAVVLIAVVVQTIAQPEKNEDEYVEPDSPSAVNSGEAGL